MTGKVTHSIEILFTCICETIKEPALITGQTAIAVTGQGSHKGLLHAGEKSKDQYCDPKWPST